MFYSRILCTVLFEMSLYMGIIRQVHYMSLKAECQMFIETAWKKEKFTMFINGRGSVPEDV